MASMVRSLHCLGRYDVGLLRNDDSTAFTVIQSPPFNEAVVTDETQRAETRRSAIKAAKSRIESADSRSRSRFLAVAHAGKKPKAQPDREPAMEVRKGAAAETVASCKTSYEQIQDLLRAYRANRAGRGRSASAGPRAPQAASPESGGYFLRRYGGKYPKENYYAHYRLYGLKK
ncbi:hypothetical protein TraAM80_01850 [Trypanosoma rangeli]|uniref:Uncharacterized protein n=1 Tax=Trypanosoma rangeli TaxID=5698 RepID=A0A422NXE5_TRYRA|nr:uncharacterized protein TraAM80_01850 [Trypanosoma rangeli]RNF10101.1 hypothetical protein TraAM80_01850 [Trypanosoma rangeli]|eukprot:RNF10101.1 hypothetical protein TraAM80_01850 [Trypanosoma rangeli]